MPELVINLFVSGLLIALGAAVKYLKAYDLIAGYNTSSREEKEYMAAKGIGNFMGWQLMLMGLVWFFGYILKALGVVWGIEIGTGLLLVLIIYTLVKAQAFAPPPDFYENNPSALKSTQNQKWLPYILVGSLIFTVVVIGSVVRTSLPPEFTLSDKAVCIGGAYGLTIDYADIEVIELTSVIPEIQGKIDGLDAGSIRKGHFQVDGWGRSLLFMRSYKKAPYLVIRSRKYSEPILINFDNERETSALFHQIKSRM
ncbi:MAG: DUF3784 domain-containing protein [Ignavibacteriales bacterium]